MPLFVDNLAIATDGFIVSFVPGGFTAVACDIIGVVEVVEISGVVLVP